MLQRMGKIWTCVVLIACLWTGCSVTQAEEPVVYDQSVAPIFRQHCAGCHNDADREGQFSLESYDALTQGVGEKPALFPGDSAASRLFQVLLPDAETRMPPEGEEPLTEAQIAAIRQWIDAGAKGPEGAAPNPWKLHVPEIATRTSTAPISFLAFAEAETVLVGRSGVLEIWRGAKGAARESWTLQRRVVGMPGPVTFAALVDDGAAILTTSGLSGAGGQVAVWGLDDTSLAGAEATPVREWTGHRDLILAAALSPDGRQLATASYDRTVRLWEVATGQLLRVLEGHTGAVYGVAFSPRGDCLATASADDTCKLWKLPGGERLDTLGQPLKESYAVAFTPDGRSIVSGGADRQLRLWDWVSREEPLINPQRLVRFAHDAAIIGLALSRDGKWAVSAGEDRRAKVWRLPEWSEAAAWGPFEDVPAAVSLTDGRAAIGLLNGDWKLLDLPLRSGPADDNVPEAPLSPLRPSGELTRIDEVEPNDSVETAQRLQAPAVVKGVIHADGDRPDEDFFRFTARAGEEWVIEVHAARDKSPLDSIVEVLTADGSAIERVVLQAVRESYFTFRGKDGSQTGDFRLFNWEEMQLNELLYCNGEVVQLWRAPRGPDSGFDVYPGDGKRWGQYDTTGQSHALGEPCYVVQPWPAGSHPTPNGLPVFRIPYENDDDSFRQHGADSKLTFTAPEDGEFVIRLRDVRGESGPEHRYQLQVRPPAPGFSVRLATGKPTISPGQGTELRFVVTRFDGFMGPVTVSVENLPDGFRVPGPVEIEAGQIEATTVLQAALDAKAPTEQEINAARFTARAEIDGRPRSQKMKGLQELKLTEKPPVEILITPLGDQTFPSVGQSAPFYDFEVRPGETISLRVAITRHSAMNEVGFGKADAGRNLPHGVYVDNIGLSGLLMLGGQNEREFFITAAPGTPPQTRLFHLKLEGGTVTSAPARLTVLPKAEDVAAPRSARSR